MRRKISVAAIMLAALLISAVLLSACSEQEKFVFEVENGEATLVRYNGNMGEVTVPDTYNGAKVTAIGEFAFVSRQSVTSVSIPETVKSIGRYAFANCGRLEEIVLPDSVKSLGRGAFFGCRRLVKADVGLCKELPEEVFKNCIALSSVTMDKVRIVGDEAFYGCDSLEKLELPDSVKILGAKAFASCGGLNEVVIGAGVEDIGGYCFDGAPVKITFAEGATLAKINANAFAGCAGESITLPGSVTDIASGAFAYCESEIVLENFSGNITGGMFIDYKGSRLALPEGVKRIERRAFEGCDELEELTIPASVEYIGYGAFADVKAKINFAEGSKLSRLEGGAFADYIGDSLTLPATITSIGASAFKDSTADIFFAEGSLLTIIEEGSFEDWEGEKIILPESLETMGDYAFAGCQNLLEITIPGGVTVLPVDVFSNCFSLEKVTLKEGLTQVGEGAFYSCEQLTAIYLPDSVTSIGHMAFGSCTLLADVRLGKNVKYIGMNAFGDCAALEFIKYAGSEEDWASVELYEGPSAIGFSTVEFNK